MKPLQDSISRGSCSLSGLAQAIRSTQPISLPREGVLPYRRESIRDRFITAPFAVHAGLIALIAVCLHGLAFAVSYQDPEARQLVEDSHGFMTLANNLVEKGRFGRQRVLVEGGPEVWTAELVRTPGYPFFLALVRMLKLPLPEGAIVLQHLAYIGVCILAAGFCRRFFGSAAGLTCGLLLALDFHAAVLANLIMSETIFCTLFLLALFCTVRTIRDDSFAYACMGGILLGAATLVKPSSAVLAGLIGMAMVFRGLWKRRPRTFIVGMVFIVMGNAPAVAWMYRNERVTGQFALWSLPRYQLLFEHAAWAMADVQGLEIEEARRRLANAVGLSRGQVRFAPLSADKEREIRRLALATLHANMAGFVRETAIRTANTLAGPDKDALIVAGMTRCSFGIIKDHASLSSKPVLTWFLLLPQFLHVAVVYLLTLYGLRIAILRRCIPIVAIVGLTFAVCLLAVSAGSPGAPRYRWPAIPLLVVVASATVAGSRSKGRHDSRAQTSASGTGHDAELSRSCSFRQFDNHS